MQFLLDKGGRFIKILYCFQGRFVYRYFEGWKKRETKRQRPVWTDSGSGCWGRDVSLGALGGLIRCSVIRNPRPRLCSQ